MERDDFEIEGCLVDLGTVADETKGSAIGLNDTHGGLKVQAGLADD